MSSFPVNLLAGHTEPAYSQVLQYAESSYSRCVGQLNCMGDWQNDGRAQILLVVNVLICQTIY